MKVVTIVGARPQFIKAAVVSRAFKEANIEEIIVHTGQHYDLNMSDVFFEEMDIPRPNYNLNINGLSHGAMTGQMLEKIESVLMKESPDMVLVYGDTNSTLAGALAAKKLHIRLAHVEAGLRSFNMDMPEEINRILTDRISDFLFCPTTTAVDNLNKEGYKEFNSQIVLSGDVMQDAAIFYLNKACKPKESVPDKYIICTIHRAENTDDNGRLGAIFKAFEEISVHTPIVIPLHPRTKAKLTAIQYDFENSNICFINPVGYLEMVWLIDNAMFVMTDSGGLQKEAYFFKKYCITLRDETEWVELVGNECNYLVGADYDKIIHQAKFMPQLITNCQPFNNKLYGNGNAGSLIVNYLKNNMFLHEN